MNTLRFACRRNIHQIRQFHKCIIQQTEAAAATATVSSTPPISESVSTSTEPAIDSKIELIANQIISLNLIEVAQLSDLLKKRLNLPDAPMMSMGSFVAPKEEEQEVVPEAVQTKFTVKLVAFNEKSKITLIKELKAILPNYNLVQAKKFVESAPVVVKADISKEEADKIMEAITKSGGTAEIV
ncbi:unnamed protein product [Xylocopa violacea]|uniref:39S ribosomal protein L12, mitochondrial n=1 Tax=Xylocopa violacea TaxID=135666 RepID=A0ABP1N3B2_XYLVO